MLQEQQLTQTPTPKLSRRTRLVKVTKIALPIFIILLVVVVLATIWGFSSYGLLKADVNQVSQHLGEMKQALKKQDLAQVKKSNLQLKLSLQKTQKDLLKYSLVSYVPIFSGYYNDAKHLVQAGLISTEAIEIGVEVVEPFADVLGLDQAKHNSTDAQAKAEIVVREVIPSLIPKIDQLTLQTRQIKMEIDQVNSHRYPKEWKINGLPLWQIIDTAQKEINQADVLLPEVKPILQVLPTIAGSPNEKNYLIIFQNDKELRATGGFITSYARAKVYAGRLVNIASGDIAELDKKIPKKDPPPAALAKYLKATEWNIRDANLNPDYQLSAQTIEDFYYRIPKVAKIDGVISIDTEFVRRLLTITGPIQSKKLHQSFSAENNNLGIPDIVYKLELYTEKILANDPNHKGFIGELMNQIISKVSSLPAEKMEPFLTTLYQAAVEKHLLFYFDNPAAQALAEKFNFAGRIKSYTEDYLYVNNSNFGGLKSNLFVRFNIDQDIKISADGTVAKTLTVSITHTGKWDNWLSANYGNWERVYTPLGSKLLDKRVPRDYDFTTGEELNKEVFRTYWETAPLKSTKGVYVYQLPFKLKKGEKYHLLMQKQPGDNFTTGTIKINGKLIKSFVLKTDQELEFAW